MGFELFKYYRYWFMWTLACLPMGFIGYYIKKKNIISMIILLPILLILAYMGLGYFSSMINNFPHHLLSFIACFLIIILVVLNLFDKTKLKIITLSIVTICTIVFIILKGGITNEVYETYRTLDDYEINFVGKIKISYFSGTSQGNVEVITSTDEIHSIKINGRKNGKYNFSVIDEAEKEYSFEYYYDKDTESIIFNQK